MYKIGSSYFKLRLGWMMCARKGLEIEENISNFFDQNITFKMKYFILMIVLIVIVESIIVSLITRKLVKRKKIKLKHMKLDD